MGGEGQMLCVEESLCIGVPSAENPMKPVGFTKPDGYFCQLGLPCCSYACKKTEVCVSSEGQCCCIKSAAALPFAASVPKPVCAVCGIQCMPNMGILQPYDG